MNNLLYLVVIMISMIFSASVTTANTSTENVITDATKHASQVIDDATIIAKIKAKLLADPDISMLDLSINSEDGYVKISGKFDTDHQAERAIEIAESIKEVKHLDTSGITVKESEQPLSDTVITGKVKGMFIKEDLLGNADISVMSINVDTKNGIVYLTGTVKDRAQVENARNLAKSIDGVKEVKSTIKVTSE